MWFDQEPFSSGQSWSALWHGFVICNCGAIRQPVQACPSCGIGPDGQDLVAKADGREVMISVAQMGAEGSYEDYIFLEMLQREWERPVVEFSRFDGLKPGERPSARAALILLFWTYFEAKIERILQRSMRFLPPAILDDALKRYSSVGVRLHTLYRLFHGTTYFDDLRHLGFGHVAVLLAEIHKKRNEFVHGNPRALNDKTVQDLVENLKDEHESWIAIYNFRLNYKRGTAEFAVPFPI